MGSGDVNDYLRSVAGDDFTAKDFRTWAGTVLAARALSTFAPFESERKAKRNVVEAITAVALVLGNTQSVCRKCYVHPAVLEAYLAGDLCDSLGAGKRRRKRALRADESAVLAFLQRKLQGRTRARRRPGPARLVDAAE